MEIENLTGFALVYTTRSRRTCREIALVLQAASIENHVVRAQGVFTFLVPERAASQAVAEIEAYLSEREEPTVEPIAPRAHSGSFAGVVVYVLIVLVVAALTWWNTFGVDWQQAGRVDASLIRHGQWWRAATALTLHASPAHLLGNAVIGGIVGYFAAQMVGVGLAWACILVGGIAGNLINATLRPGDHFSIGASTAVFAALGLIAAVAQKGRAYVHRPWLLRFAPIIGATVLLAFLGTGSGRTDVGAHVFGFLSGLAVGAIFGAGSDSMLHHVRLQRTLGVMALAVLVTAWVIALVR